ncbi:hypothetical protein DW182_15905 [Bacteroides sp. AM16-24]|uniref:hypothetical protein n=1 Tax=Bacteroides sp. AM16-24 TaxID=2292002 RepID=UPI000E4B575C|nr:hypothetical protein [Bacteroides sp. AM16-24]RHI05090.1 hypothetical protein DW182_15905 [Bacteroides sp. AM16-24]
MDLNTIKNTGNWGNSASRLNENFSKIKVEIEKLKHFSESPFVGYFDSVGKLPARTEPAWALAGDLATAKPYAYYVAGNIPIGYVAGWNDLSATLGTYDFTELANYVSKNEMFNVIRGKNLCNPEDLKAGVYLNSSGGTQNGASYAVTGFIPINEGETLCCNRTISSVACNVLYAADKTTVIAAFQNSASQILTWQEGASFARFSIQNNLSNVQVEVGNSPTSYEEYVAPKNIVKEELLPDVTTEKITDGAVTEDKVSFIREVMGKNRCNPADVKDNVYLNQWGQLASNSSYAVTGFIPINEGETLCCNGTNTNNSYNLLYASDKTTVIAAVQNSTSKILTWQEGAAFARFSIDKVFFPSLDNIQVEEGTASTTYEPYAVSKKINKSLIPDNATDIELPDSIVTTSKIADSAVTEEKSVFFEPSDNLLNPNDPDYKSGYYVNYVYGTIVANPSYDASGFIAVVAGENYTISHSIYNAWYDLSKKFISGINNHPGGLQTVLAPENAVYIRVSIPINDKGSFMVNKGNSLLPYVPYGNKLKEKYLPDSLIADSFVNKICLPSKLYMLDGVQNDLFVEAFTKRYRPYMEDVRFSGTATYQRRLKRVASIKNPVEGKTVIASLIERINFTEVDKQISTLVVSIPSAGDGEIAVQIIGDSITNGAFFGNALITNNYVPGINLIGLRDSLGYSGYYDEGRGGWTLARYFRVSTGRTEAYNGFWQPEGNFRYYGDTAFWKLANDIRKNTSGNWTFDESYNAGRFQTQSIKFDDNTGLKLNPASGDIMYDNANSKYILYNGSSWIDTTYDTYTWGFNYAKYLSAWGLTPPSICAEFLGVNDFMNSENPDKIDFSTWDANLETMIASYKEAVPDGKFVVMLPLSTMGTEDNDSGLYNTKKSAAMWTARKHIIDTFDKRESESIYILDIAITCDNEYGYNMVNDEEITKPYAGYSGGYRYNVQTGNPHPYAAYPTMGIPLAAFIQKYR